MAQEWRKLKKPELCSKSVVFGWEILKYRNIVHVAWPVLTPEIQLSFTLL